MTKEVRQNLERFEDTIVRFNGKEHLSYSDSVVLGWMAIFIWDFREQAWPDSFDERVVEAAHVNFRILELMKKANRFLVSRIQEAYCSDLHRCLLGRFSKDELDYAVKNFWKEAS
jgi:hypothetical protein